jgi:hypothetical protein
VDSSKPEDEEYVFPKQWYLLYEFTQRHNPEQHFTTVRASNLRMLLLLFFWKWG